MKNDTTVFLRTMLGIPLALSGAWGVHAAYDASTMTVIAPEPAFVPAVYVPTGTETGTVTPVTAVTQKIIVPAPVVPTPTPTPVVTPTPEPIVTAPTPAKKVVVKSRHTRAS